MAMTLDTLITRAAKTGSQEFQGVRIRKFLII